MARKTLSEITTWQEALEIAEASESPELKIALYRKAGELADDMSEHVRAQEFFRKARVMENTLIIETAAEQNAEEDEDDEKDSELEDETSETGGPKWASDDEDEEEDPAPPMAAPPCAAANVSSPPMAAPPGAASSSAGRRATAPPTAAPPSPAPRSQKDDEEEEEDDFEDGNVNRSRIPQKLRSDTAAAMRKVSGVLKQAPARVAGPTIVVVLAIMAVFVAWIFGASAVSALWTLATAGTFDAALQLTFVLVGLIVLHVLVHNILRLASRTASANAKRYGRRLVIVSACAVVGAWSYAFITQELVPGFSSVAKAVTGLKDSLQAKATQSSPAPANTEANAPQQQSEAVAVPVAPPLLAPSGNPDAASLPAAPPLTTQAVSSGTGQVTTAPQGATQAAPVVSAPAASVPGPVGTGSVAPSGGNAPLWFPPLAAPNTSAPLVSAPAATATPEFPQGLSEEWRKVPPLTVKAIAQETDAGVIAFASYVGNGMGRGKDGKPSFDPQELLKVRELAESIHAAYGPAEVVEVQNLWLGKYEGMSASPDGQLIGVPQAYASGVQEVLRLAKRR